MSLLLRDFNYNLPLELIAQKPARPRDHSRLLVLNKKTGAISHQHFYNLPEYLKAGDVLILNNSKVFPARLIGKKKETGGAVEIFLHHKLSSDTWECLIGGRIKEGTMVEFKDRLQTTILKNNQDGTWQVKFNFSGVKLWAKINKIGLVPLPPYIKRAKKKSGDKNNYQTVFADSRHLGSVAAPTAGLHFTKALLKKIKAQGVKIVYITLHVGLGTFAPVKTEKIINHKMHREFVSISAVTAKEIIKAKKEGRRVIAVGTTSCRTLEAVKSWMLGREQSFWTDIFIYPGYKFRTVDALITNFHLPKSTLLMLVSALAGQNNINCAYQAAIGQKYHFFSYGDAMFIC